MPSIKDFEKMKKPSERIVDTDAAADAAPKLKKARRRPGREERVAEPLEEISETQDVRSSTDQQVIMADAPQGSGEAEEPILAQDAHEETEPSAERPRIEFFGREALRARAPQAFDLAETVADQWKNDGDFADLPLPHPAAKLAVQVGLRKAKDLEKKLEEKGVFMIARMGLQYAKTKLRK